MNRRLLFLYGWSHPYFGSWRKGSLCGRNAVGGCCRTQVVAASWSVVWIADFQWWHRRLSRSPRLYSLFRSSIDARPRFMLLPIGQPQLNALGSEYRCCFLFSHSVGAHHWRGHSSSWNFASERLSAMSCCLWYRSCRRNIGFTHRQITEVFWLCRLRLVVAALLRLANKEFKVALCQLSVLHSLQGCP